MDKLEKALEKSRRLRDAALPGQTRSSVPAPSRHETVEAPAADEIGRVDAEHLERNRIVAHLTRSAEADTCRQLRTQVLQIMAKSGYRTLAVTSPNYGDGKTTVAINLAVSIALDLKQTVMIADLDLRKPNLPHYLGIQPTAGLTDYLLDNVPLADCLIRQPFERVTVLPAGRALDNSSEVIGSPKMAALAREMKQRYADRIIIYDMPPVLTQDDPLAFLPQIDAVLVVVRDGVTKAEDLRRCLSILQGANVIGTVLNNCF
jgi:Mrp family chromosome partitioning ATPase